MTQVGSFSTELVVFDWLFTAKLFAREVYRQHTVRLMFLLLPQVPQTHTRPDRRRALHSVEGS
jgi:hypothetical protein